MKNVIKKITGFVPVMTGFAIFLTAAVLFLSCNNISEAGGSAESNSQKAVVSLSVNRESARTIMPSNLAEDDISKIELTAEKYDSKSQKYLTYSFDEKSSSLSWESISQAENAKIELDFGKYNFTLKIYVNEESEERCVQTGILQDEEISASTTSLDFITKYGDSGNLSIKIYWPCDEEGQSNIGSAEAGLFTIEGKGILPLRTDEKVYDFEPLYNDFDNEYIDDVFAGKTRTDDESYARYFLYNLQGVPNGSYYLITKIYACCEEGATPDLLGTITDIVKINGFKTENVMLLDLDELNFMYDVTYDLNGGAWADESADDSKNIRRNVYTGILLPTSEDLTPPADKNRFLGWYTSDGEKIDSIDTGSETARDYRLRAEWDYYFESEGSVKADNRALSISIDTNEIYLNTKIKISATELDGSQLDEGDGLYIYSPQILHKGKYMSSSYFSFSFDEESNSGGLKLSGALPKDGTYQLYVTASRKLTNEEPIKYVTSNQTFDIQVHNICVTPDTQVALYNYDGENYSYYLTEDSKIEQDLPESATITGKGNNSAFDAKGYFYAMKDDYVYSDNDKIPASGVQLAANAKFLIDIKRNMAYAYTDDSSVITLYKYPDLISYGASSGVITYPAITKGQWCGGVIENNVLYVLNVDGPNYSIKTYDIPSDGSAITETGIEMDFSSEIPVSEDKPVDSHDIQDMFVQDGCVYILLKQVDVDYSFDFYSRGTVIKVDLIKEESYHIDWINDDEKIVPGEGDYFYAYNVKTGDTITDNNYRVGLSDYTPVLFSCADFTGENQISIYAASDENYDKYLYGPSRIIAVKPKQLVISDEGYSFYTDDSLFAYNYKNVNRVVTIDLDSFSIGSVTDVKAKFTADETEKLPGACSYSMLEQVSLYNSEDEEVISKTASIYCGEATSLTVNDAFNDGKIFYGIPCEGRQVNKGN